VVNKILTPRPQRAERILIREWLLGLVGLVNWFIFAVPSGFELLDLLEVRLEWPPLPEVSVVCGWR